MILQYQLYLDEIVFIGNTKLRMLPTQLEVL